jgi:hypothetical protein
MLLARIELGTAAAIDPALAIPMTTPPLPAKTDFILVRQFCNFTQFLAGRGMLSPFSDSPDFLMAKTAVLAPV